MTMETTPVPIEKFPSSSSQKIQNSARSVSHKIRMQVGGHFWGKPNHLQHEQASKYFLDLFDKSIDWGIKQNKLRSFNVALPTNDPEVTEIILDNLVDDKQYFKGVNPKRLGDRVKAYLCWPTHIPGLWVRELVTKEFDGQTHTTREIMSEELIFN